MQIVNFFMPVNLETGHPTFQQPALWYGRAIITQETDYDDRDQPFTFDVAEITDLFFLPSAGADIKTARRVELPDNSKNGQTFRFKLQQAAITAYHNPALQPAEMPDEVEPDWTAANPAVLDGNISVNPNFVLIDEYIGASPSFSEKLAAMAKEIAAAGLTADDLSKRISINLG